MKKSFLSSDHPLLLSLPAKGDLVHLLPCKISMYMLVLKWLPLVTVLSENIVIQTIVYVIRND